MFKKFATKICIRIISFVSLFLLGVSSFNLFHLNEKLQMLQLANEFHNAQVNNDKTVIDNLLADNFLETGAKYSVRTPDVIYKKDLVNYDYSKVHVESIEAKYPLILNVFSNSNMSLSFVRELTLSESRDFPRYYVTYTFEKHNDGLKIIKAERKLCF